MTSNIEIGKKYKSKEIEKKVHDKCLAINPKLREKYPSGMPPVEMTVTGFNPEMDHICLECNYEDQNHTFWVERAKMDSGDFTAL